MSVPSHTSPPGRVAGVKDVVMVVEKPECFLHFVRAELELRRFAISGELELQNIKQGEFLEVVRDEIVMTPDLETKRFCLL